MSLLRSIATVGGYTGLSRVLGFVRDILIAAILGAGWVADCFFVAFKIPNFFRRLFAEGAFNAGFVPLFSGLLAREGMATAKRFAEETLAVFVVTLLLFVALMQAAMPWAMMGLAPGFVDEAEKFDLAVALTRLTFPYLFFISLVSLLGGILNSLGRFAAVAATPILLNLALITALLGFAGRPETPAHALAWGVSAAGILQFLWLIVVARRAGVVLRLPRPRLTPRVRELLVLMLPAAIGAGVVQVNLMVDVIIASLLPSGSLSYLFFADRLNQLPLGVVGVAVGTALLPLLSRQLAAGQDAPAMESQNRALEFALVLTLPAATALMVMPGPLVGVLFERGAFDSQATHATAAALAAYAVGLPAYVLVKVLGPGFFARRDTRTPVRYAIIAMFVNLALNLALMGPLQHVGLALATALSAWLNAGMLGLALWRRGHLRVDRRLARRLPRMVLASAGMGLALWFGAASLATALGGGGGEPVAALAALVIGGLLVYGLLALLLGLVTVAELKAVLAKGGTGK